ncbi:heparinase II/III family protein [Novilysobacter antarcticus]|uniref:heparinase II/III family protein n=1 Tax=Novilysobacter antarcticus TaxID=2862543 RepID=UPI001C9907E5|nr:heparinase II/III family protein [Lysobacter antarcticus]
MRKKLLRLWHTVRWLRPVQFYGRVWFRLARPRPDLSVAPALRGPAAVWRGCARAPSMTGEHSFRFLGVERELAAAGDWNRSDWSKLWLYNAHYFDDLAADGATARVVWHQALIGRWITENPPGQGNGWEPYPSSLRIVNWIKWSLGGNPLEPAAVHSLAVQARYLRRRLEIHLLGNHLWANAKALVFVGAFFEGDEAAAWLHKGAVLVERELAEQFLSDGGHFERSPMYHSILLEDVLDLVQLDRIYPGILPTTLVARLREGVGPMVRWLRVMTHPDGDIALFNDAALGIAPPLAALEHYARALSVPIDNAPLAPLEVLPESGYVRMTAGPAVMIADVGPVGPDYLPGHAHADTLSFELSLHGQRVLVNGGTSTYEAGPLRLQQRGTAMHNTVEVDGQDSSEVWSSFRVARRARPMNIRWAEEAGILVLEAAHDGYLRLPGRVMHSRRWELSDGGLTVIDALSGRAQEAVARYRFVPGLDADSIGFAWRNEGAAAATVPGAWYPRFGEEHPCRVLECRISHGQMSTEFSWR